MQFITDYPVRSSGEGGWTSPETMVDVIQHLERVGIHGLGFTDHPAPSRKWLENGGHEAFDPFAALAFAAAVTSRIRLFSHLLVLPYRNPLLQVSGMASVDVLSGGRSTFILGTGYLRSEFSALGIAFDERNAIFDESIEVILKASGNQPVLHSSPRMEAIDQVVLPGFVQLPHPPLWLGGNSALTLRRLATWGQGWSVMMGSPTLSRTARTRSIETNADLAQAIAELSGLLDQRGRSLSEVSIQASTPTLRPNSTASHDEQIDAIEQLRGIGVTWVLADLWAPTVSESLDRFEDFAQNVASQLDPTPDSPTKGTT